MLNPINKEDKPLVTFHIDDVGPMEETKKRCNYILVVIDAFSKFVWLYPTRSTGSDEVLDRLEKQSAVFGNPSRIITDRGSGFTSNAFEDYCKKQSIQHLVITTGVPRGNGQVERVHKVVMPMLTKLCVENPKLWYKHVDRVQQIINSTPTRSTKYSPFKLLIGVDMRVNASHDIRGLLEESAIEQLDEERNIVREEARSNIARIQKENIQNFNKNRKKK